MEKILNQSGIKTKSTKNSLKIFGNSNLKNKTKFTISSNYDHRIAMAASILSLISNINIKINNFDTVNTSFPKYLELLKKIGAKFEIKKKH